jgi:hypothetical protein
VQQLMMMHFCRNFVSGGFLITFGQFVPSWDSSYYQLMMTQNIPQRLLEFKMVAHGYRYNCYYNHCFLLSLLWGTVYLTIIGAIYNIGVNSHLVLLWRVHKTPIDLSSGKGAFGDKAFNVKPC